MDRVTQSCADGQQTRVKHSMLSILSTEESNHRMGLRGNGRGQASVREGQREGEYMLVGEQVRRTTSALLSAC